jgi:hypothetical protein
VIVRAWNATAASSASWAAGPEALGLNAARTDYGITASVERRSTRAATSAGARLVHGATKYQATGAATTEGRWNLDGAAVVAALFARQVRTIGDALQLDLGITGSVLQGTFYPAPRAALTWIASNRFSLSGSASRTWQFTQSLRNPESVVGNVFPAELYVNAAAPGVPVLRSDLGVLAARYHAFTAIQVTLELFVRGDEGLLLIAPATGEPFATGAFAVGSGSARGGSLELTWSKGRFDGSASYALQEVQYTYAAGHYVPGYGVAQQLELGVAFNPSPSWSFRLGALGALGRRATEVTGAFEWEACNLVDRGCEFGGSPTSSSALSAATLPAYFRMDLGVRKQWSVSLGGRPGIMALFGTVTNLFGRSNVLTFVTDPVTGVRTPVEMRPFAPLVVGIDWSF